MLGGKDSYFGETRIGGMRESLSGIGEKFALAEHTAVVSMHVTRRALSSVDGRRQRFIMPSARSPVGACTRARTGAGGVGGRA